MTSRRDFLRRSAAVAVAMLHEPTFAWHPAREVSRHTAASGAPRLLGLALETAATLPEMKRFYHGTLGLRVVEDSATRLTIAGGETRVTFTPAAEGRRAPFYHFAFNIPENKIERAWAWQRSHGPLLPIPERLRDSRFPDEVVNYAHWNAHSVFFLDPGGNVVEYIARHDLANGRAGDFGPQDILYASEIAFIVEDVPSTSAFLKHGTRLADYLRAGDENFWALGDEHGLVLVMKRGRILNFNPASQEKAAAVFPTQAIVRGQPGVVRIEGFPYQLRFQ